MPNLTGVENHKKIIFTFEIATLTLSGVQNFIKIETSFVLRLWPIKCKVLTLTGSRITENYCHQWIQHLQIVQYAKFRGKWLTSFLIPLSPFPVHRSLFLFLKIAKKILQKFVLIALCKKNFNEILKTNSLNKFFFAHVQMHNFNASFRPLFLDEMVVFLVS